MNNYEISKKLSNYNNQKIDSIRKIYIGSVALLSTTPICIYNINIDDLPVVALTILEVGAVTIPIIGIKDIIKSTKKMRLIKECKNNSPNDLDKVINSYKIVQDDLNHRIEVEKSKQRKKELKKLRNNIKRYSNNI